MIRFENIRKKGVLNDVSFSLEKGRFCVLSEHENDALGVISALCGLSIPDSGSVKTDGRVHFIAKGAPIPSFLTVKEYFDTVKAFTTASEIPSLAKEIQDEYEKCVIGTLDDLDRYYVALSASLIGSPSAIAAAYPLSGVRFEQRELLNGFIDEISQVVPTVYTSAYPSMCRENEQVLVLSTGKCVGLGAAESVFDKKSASLVCKVKGDISALDLGTLNAEYKINEGSDGRITEITFLRDGKEFRESVKEAIASAGLALISVKGEHDILEKVIDALYLAESEEREASEAPSAPQKLSAESLSFSNDEQEEEYGDASEKKLSSLGFYSDDEDSDEESESESTLFSDEEEDSE